MRTFAILFFLIVVSAPCFGKGPITIYLAGDSTMASKLLEKRPETGWGEALQKFFREHEVRIENHAKNGRSTRTFIEEKLWQAIVDKLRKGDYVFIEFGHNDSSKEKTDRYTPPEDYRRNLIRFVNEVRAKQAIPVLLTPVMRRRFDERGKFFDTHGEYPDIVRSVAAENRVALIDMHRKSEKVLLQYGAEPSRKLFLQLKPNENPNYPSGIEDNTHFNPFGADIMARLAVAGIREQRLGLAKYLKEKGGNKVGTSSVLWEINTLDRIGGHATTVSGEPKVIETPEGGAVLFDGVDDGLTVESNPVAGARAFTIEAIFRPEAGGAFEQRWFHIQADESEDRILLETRVTGDQWFLDTFIKSGENNRPLFAENFKHPVGVWYHVALVYDGTTMRHFVDGNEELSGALAIQPIDKGRTSLGVRLNQVFWFKGAIRAVRVTPRALSPKEFMKKK